jgi:hypothetical protein
MPTGLFTCILKIEPSLFETLHDKSKAKALQDWLPTWRMIWAETEEIVTADGNLYAGGGGWDLMT